MVAPPISWRLRGESRSEGPENHTGDDGMVSAPPSCIQIIPRKEVAVAVDPGLRGHHRACEAAHGAGTNLRELDGSRTVPY